MDSWRFQTEVSGPRFSCSRPDDTESDWEQDELPGPRTTAAKVAASAMVSSPSLPAMTSTMAIGCLDDGALHRVLSFLDPSALFAVAACNNRLRGLVNDPLSDLELWKSFYSRRWRPPSGASSSSPPSSTFWRDAYRQRLRDAAALGAPRKPFVDLLPGGHRGPVRAACFATSTDGGSGAVLATGGADMRIRLWDLGSGGGAAPQAGPSFASAEASGELLCCSSPLPGSVRCVASGSGLLVSGSGVDARIAVWRQREIVAAAEESLAEEEEKSFESDEGEAESNGDDPSEGDDSSDGDDPSDGGREEENDDDGDRSVSSEGFDSSDDDEGTSSCGPSEGEGAGTEGDGSDDDGGGAAGVRGLRFATRGLRLGGNSATGARGTRRRSRGREGPLDGGVRGETHPSSRSGSRGSPRSSIGGSSKRPSPFDLSSAPPLLLSGHGGPVAAVAVDDEEQGGLIYSASWDMTVRIWDLERGTREEDEGLCADGGRAPRQPYCAAGLYQLDDWCWSVAPRASRVLVAEGRGAAVFDAETGRSILRISPSEADGGRRGDAARVEGTRDGRTLFLARADGSLESFDLRATASDERGRRRGRGSCSTSLLLPGGPAPSGLAFDDPWIALASGRGGVALLDARRPRTPLMKASPRSKSPTETASSLPLSSCLPIPRPPRRLGFANNVAVRCVEVLGRWVVGGCDDGSVRTWCFGGGGGEATADVGRRRRLGRRRSRCERK